MRVDKMKRILDKPCEKDELVYPKRLCNTIGNLISVLFPLRFTVAFRLVKGLLRLWAPN
jgi:hypothetical protein